MNSPSSLQTPQAGAVMRAVLALAGGTLLLFGGSGLLVLLRLFTMQADLRPGWLGQHDLIMAALLAIVALSLLMIGVNLLFAAWHARRRNVVPGPTLYLIGVTLVVLGMFQLTAGALMSALALGMFGALAMWLEMQFDFI